MPDVILRVSNICSNSKKQKKNLWHSHLIVHYGPQTHYANVNIIFGVAHVQLCSVSRSPFNPGTVQRIQSGSRVIRCIAVADPIRVHVHGSCKQTKQKWWNLSTHQIYHRGVSRPFFLGEGKRLSVILINFFPSSSPPKNV